MGAYQRHQPFRLVIGMFIRKNVVQPDKYSNTGVTVNSSLHRMPFLVAVITPRYQIQATLAKTRGPDRDDRREEA